MLTIDLHIHSYYSCDGDYSTKKILEMASLKRLKYIAITDHNTIDGLDEAIKFGEEYGINVIPSIEIDSIFMKQNLHILGYYINWKDNRLDVLNKSIKNEQITIVNKTIEKLNILGLELNHTQVLENSNSRSIPGYASIAKALIKNKSNSKHYLLKPIIDADRKIDRPILDLMSNLLYPGKPAYIENKKYPSTENVIKLILKIGGVPVLAHPGQYFSPNSEVDIKKIEILKQYGLIGIESFSSYHSENMNKEFQKLSRRMKLIQTAGSDFHGRLKPDVKIGVEISNFQEMIKKLKMKKY
jgi:3',5'-nucleoside bisphosphate phosphatase